MLEAGHFGGINAAGAVMWGATACVSLYLLITVKGIRILLGTASLVLIALAACLQAGFLDVPALDAGATGSGQLLFTLSSLPMLLSVLLTVQYRQQRGVQETALANAISGIFIATLDGRLSYANASFMKLVGARNIRNLAGRSAYDFFDNPEKAREIFEIARDKGSWRGEVFARRADGSTTEVDLQASVTHDARGMPTAIIGSFADLSENREKERQLRFSNSLLTNLVESAPLLLWTADSAGEIGLVCGRGFDRIKLLAEDDPTVVRPAPGTSMYDLFHNVPDIDRHVSRVLSGKPVRFEWQCSDSVSFEAQLSPRHGPAGTITGLVGVALDVSDRVAAEAALERNMQQQVEIEQRLDRAQRFETVGRLTGGIAHDFNNLLTTILGNVDLVADQMDARTDLKHYAQSAARAAERGAELTQRLLAFSRQQALCARPTDVHKLLDEMTSVLGRILPETIRIKTDYDRSPVVATVDPGQLENAILNLALNARDAMPEGGTLTISTRACPRPSGQGAEGDFVVITVRDTGVGMSEEVLSKAFEPFFTTKKGETSAMIGSGLGLSMVNGFAAQSKGRVEIDSKPGKGATVTLLLPRAEAVQGAAEEKVKELREIQKGSDRIMVVEDDTDVRQFVVNALKRLGYTVIAAEDGPQAMQVANEAEKIDLLISDVVLPGGMTGPDVADRFLEIFPKGKVLFTSGYIGDDLVMRSRLESDVELLSKPYTLQALAAKVRTVLDPTIH
jgi:PAS domain S-box-containing protein